MTEVANRDIPLKWDVFVAKRQGLTRDLPPGTKQQMWSPISPTLIYDKMLERYPDRANPGSLWGSACAVKG
jgi:hypothetical protein